MVIIKEPSTNTGVLISNNTVIIENPSPGPDPNPPTDWVYYDKLALGNLLGVGLLVLKPHYNNCQYERSLGVTMGRLSPFSRPITTTNLYYY